MVLVPEVVQALKGFEDVSILAAGGIVTGRQMAAAMAMGADGMDRLGLANDRGGRHVSFY